METPNLKYIKKISEGDLDFEESLLNIITEEFPKEYATFIEKFNNKDYEESANNVHKIKHKISLLGLEKGLALASVFEKDLKNGNTELYQDFINVLHKIHVYLEDY
ncbi:Hpt domain-containing protein [uncultured Polaribacter sp.]|uniref:Hpt domain-containing protein n=1 Tax=uncultured Polaribacter sp. TaxID=174711 RepID=UPI00263994B1|nr:Hpt domain-containing protein [uncultured Polaribacter sp.]